MSSITFTLLPPPDHHSSFPLQLLQASKGTSYSSAHTLIVSTLLISFLSFSSTTSSTSRKNRFDLRFLTFTSSKRWLVRPPALRTSASTSPTSISRFHRRRERRRDLGLSRSEGEPKREFPSSPAPPPSTLFLSSSSLFLLPVSTADTDLLLPRCQNRTRDFLSPQKSRESPFSALTSFDLPRVPEASDILTSFPSSFFTFSRLIAPAFYEPDFDRPTRPTSPSPSAPSLLSRITSPPRGPRSQLVQERSPPQTFIPPSRPIPTGPRTSSQEYSPQVSTIATSPSTTYRRRSPPPQGRSLAPSFPPPLASSAALFPPHPQTPELGSIVGAQQYPDPQLDPPRAEPGSLREVMQQIRLDNARRRPGALEVGTNGGRIADGHDLKNKEQQVGSASRERDAGSSSLSDAVASKQEEAARRSGPVDRPQRPSTSTSTQQPTRSRPSALSFFNENERIKIEPDEQPLNRPESSTPSASSQPPRAVAQQPNPLSTSHHPQQPSLAISSRPVTASLASASRPSRRSPSPSTSTVPRPAKGTSRGRSPEFFDRRAMRDEPSDLEGRRRTVEGRRRVEEEDEMRRLTGRGRAEEGRHGEPKDGGERSGGKTHWVRKKSLGDVRRESDEREAARWKAS